MDRSGRGTGTTRRLLDAFARALARFLLAIFYRSSEARGLERVPARGPVLFVANHGNALVDPMVLVALLPRVPRFLAKHTLWSNPAVWPLLELVGAVPVYRAQEGDTARNQETFARSHAELARGGAVALFPEGISHDRPALQPLRTGAARIALGAAATGAAPIEIVPIGLTFEDKRLFRSRLLLCVGEPIAVEPASTDDAEAVHALTEAIDAGLRAVTLNTDSWRTAKLVERAAEIYGGDPARAMPGVAALGEHFSLRHSFGAGYDAARAAEPARVAALEAMARRYELLLEAFKLRDDHVTADYPLAFVAGYVRDTLPALAARLPFAAIGYVLNALPYHAVGRIARLVEHEGDQPATYKLLAGFFLFPITWGIECAAAASAWGAPGALAMAAIAPVTGWIALRFYERNESFWSEARAYLTLRAVPHYAAELRALRRMMREELAALVNS
jgi:glycerol-3-phosphate O-acyltransferase / dihydroxyacetone phosphate acyltransferase